MDGPSGTSRFTKASHTNMRCPPVKSKLRTENSEVGGTEELPSPQCDDEPIGNSRATFQEEMPRQQRDGEPRGNSKAPFQGGAAASIVDPAELPLQTAPYHT